MPGDIEKFFKNKKTFKKGSVYKKFAASRKKTKKRKQNLKFIVFILSVALLFGMLGSTGYLFCQHKKTIKSPSAESRNEAGEIVEKIKGILDLPDEDPIMATVSDKDKLQGRFFFRNAENGDKILVFNEAQKAIIYRPGSGKVVEMTSLYSQKTAAETGNDRKRIGVAVLNATGKKGIAAATADKISQIRGIEIKEKETAEKMHEKTVVVDFSGGNASIIEEIIELIGGSPGEIPEGEKIPLAEILIVVGKESLEN